MGHSALVVEGGAMRSIYPAGVLDVFQEAGFDPFERCYGVSAGALNLTSFLAGKHGRNYRILTELAVQPEFISVRRGIRRDGSIMDIDWLWEAMMQQEPLDAHSVLPEAVRERLFVCSTRVRDGQTVYFQPDEQTWPVLARATCALPLFYRRPVHFAGEQWLDGAVSDPLPVLRAHRDGATRIFVIRTRHAGYRKRVSFGDNLVIRALRKHEGLRETLAGLPDRYNRCAEFIEQPPTGVETVQIAPSRPLRTGRTTRDRLTLEADYRLGRADAIAFLEQAGHHCIPDLESHPLQRVANG